MWLNEAKGMDKEMRNKNRITKKGYIKGSFTVEASFLVPIILFTIIGGINIGYDMFQEAKSSSQIQKELKELDPVKIVRKNTMMKGILKGETYGIQSGIQPGNE